MLSADPVRRLGVLLVRAVAIWIVIAVAETPHNLSILESSKARAIRFSTLDAICRALDCQPGDLLAHDPVSAP